MVIYKMWFYIFIYISFATTCLASGSYYCGTGFINPDEFKCNQGSDCISKSKVCDGSKDCADGSDEELCSRYESKSGTCDLPPYPEHGTYEVLNVPSDRTHLPGQSFQSFTLKLKCDLGYGVVERGYGEDVNGTREISCKNGKWSQSMPQCVRFCRLDPDPSVHYVCSGAICEKYVPPGTIVNPICNRPIYTSSEGLVYMTCNAGSWDSIARCRADCGRVTPLGVELVIDGKPVMRGELPWHVGIYRKPRPYTQVCGGSLISNDVVISAAHCFWIRNERQPASNYLVAVGKLYREWDDKRDNDAQRSHVIKILIPALFDGAIASFQEDIAVLILRTSFTYKTFVRPVCISYDDIFDRLQLQHGNLGKVAGWGITSANGDPSSYLQVVQMPFINEATCIKTFPITFRPYVTGDKFCAGYTNGTGVCKGDSGGGLVFSENSHGLDQYYLRGIVSTAPTIDGQICNDRSYTTFTKITKHQEFIQKARAEAYFLKSCRTGHEEYCNQNPVFVDDFDEPNNTSEEVMVVPLQVTSIESKGETKPKDCVFPPYPEFGTYKAQTSTNARPGQRVDSFVLTVSCRKGFGVVDPVGGNGKSNKLTCINGTYKQKMPKCVRFCKLNTDASIQYTCQVPGVGYGTCESYVAPGTLVHPSCNKPFYSSPNTLRNMKCNSFGYFDYLAQCEAECGRAASEGQPLKRAVETGGKAAKRGEMPWHVGIYDKMTTPYPQICGGTLIKNNLVLSGAHCFWRETTKKQPASNYAVAAGKLYREWNSNRDFQAQKSDVKEIRIPSLYQGAETNLQEDIAALILETPFSYTSFIQPVCLNNDLGFEQSQLHQGSSGKAAGWGLTSDGKASNYLQIIEMGFIPSSECIRNVPLHFREFITADKFCANHTGGKPLCRGDSGGGLSFSDRGQGKDRYYLRGIASLAPPSEEKLCDELSYVTFTRILKHKDFVDEAIEAGAENKCNAYEFQCDDGSCVDEGADCNGVQECKDGSDETEQLCTPGFEPVTAVASPAASLAFIPSVEPPKAGCVLPEFPKHGTYETNIRGGHPGESFDSVILTVTCREGYRMTSGGTAVNGNQVQCVNGRWNQNMPTCVRFCRLPLYPGTSYLCQGRNATEFTACEDYVASDTTVSVNCGPGYYSSEGSKYMMCLAGWWDSVIRCQIDCGQESPQGLTETVLGNGLLDRRGEVPWHVGIHRKTPKPYTQICGGSIIANNLVISAAQCFWNEKLLPASDYVVAAGKIYRAWSDVRDADSQKSEVKNIDVPPRYRGSDNDIAVLTLLTPFEFKDFVKPVCLNFDYNLDKKQIQYETIGKVAGWGQTSPAGNFSPVLKVIQLQTIDNMKCRSTVSIFDDQFCAESTNVLFGQIEFGVTFAMRGMCTNMPRFANKPPTTIAQFNPDPGLRLLLWADLELPLWREYVMKTH